MERTEEEGKGVFVSFPTARGRGGAEGGWSSVFLISGRRELPANITLILIGRQWNLLICIQQIVSAAVAATTPLL